MAPSLRYRVVSRNIGRMRLPAVFLLPFVVLACKSGEGGHSNTTDGGPAGGDGSVPIDTPDGPLSETCKGVPYGDVYLADPKLCLTVFASGPKGLRQMAFAPNGDLFVTTPGQILALYDEDGDRSASETERATFASAPRLNHGLAFAPDGAYVYASSDTTVYRWAYQRGDRSASGEAEVVVKGIPGGGHVTRTLLFDREGRLYVSIGSAGNVDATPEEWATRSLIRRYDVAAVPEGGYEVGAGELFASGLRNEVGLTLDSQGRMWGVENGRDNLTDPTFGNIVNDNPAEELNRFDVAAPGKFYGYPFCWTEGVLASGGQGPGTSWPDRSPELPAEHRKTNEYCRDASAVVPVAFAMPAHWAPLGIVEYTGSVLPWKGDLFVTAHGSWNREPATGRLIARAHVNADGSIASVEPIVAESDGAGGAAQGRWEVRPVDIVQGPDEALYVSDDASGRILRIGYR